MSDDLSLSLVAYKKVMFHCLRYASSNVVGVLVGSKDTIKDAFPLFHTPIVNPTLEIALELVEAQLPADSKIVGLYYSNVSPYELSDVHDRIAKQIAENSGVRVVLMRVYMDKKNDEASLQYDLKLGPDRTAFAYKQHKFDSLQKDLVEGKHRLIIDLDAHFENIQLDFTNSYV